MVQFGKRAGDVIRGGGQFELFMKTFRDPRTPVSFLWDNPEIEFIEFREHFDRALKVSYPCAVSAEAVRCVGCDYPVEHPEWTNAWIREQGSEHGISTRDDRRKADPGWDVRDSAGKWAFPAVPGEDPNKTFASVYKIGYNFWLHLRELHKELGSITNQRFVVLKAGDSFNTTAFSAMPTGKPVLVPKEPISFKAVMNILDVNYAKAFAKYVEAGYVDEAGTPAHDPTVPFLGEFVPLNSRPAAPTGASDEAQAVVEPARPKDVASEALAGHKTKAKVAPTTNAQMPKSLDGIDPADFPSDWDPVLNARQASLPDLKDWLDRHPAGPIEYSPKQVRSVLVGLVEKSQVPF